VNALMKHGLESSAGAEEPAPHEQVATEEPMVPAPIGEALAIESEPEVPVLTEVYEGEPPIPASHSLADLDVSTAGAEVQDEEALEAIVAELMPLIRAEVKKAVRQELVNMEKIVNHRLETEFIQTLMQRLRSESAD
jgi:hypothetical protein